MGSDKPASAAGAGGPPPAAVAVCCMCGDQGLLSELFRCAACSARSQHTYCTERYPKVESYGTCNWCLRAGQGSAGATSSSSPGRPTVKVAGAVRPTPPVASCSDDVPTGRSVAAKQLVAARRDFTAELNKPIKKKQQQQQQQRRIGMLRRSASDLGSGADRARARARVRADHGLPPSPGGGVSRGRPRVRRYKLLEEVISS